MNDSTFVDGKYQGYRVSVRRVREGDRDYTPRAINNSSKVYRFFKGISGLDREFFYAAHLD